jgi:hypothetical protein
VIPEITDGLGLGWKQPPRDLILLNEDTAVMARATWERLAEYSCSNPSGVYDGKMWRQHSGARDYRAKEITPYLCWYGPSDLPGSCSINYRRVFLLEDVIAGELVYLFLGGP